MLLSENIAAVAVTFVKVFYLLLLFLFLFLFLSMVLLLLLPNDDRCDLLECLLHLLLKLAASVLSCGRKRSPENDSTIEPCRSDNTPRSNPFLSSIDAII
jgi:hypothetical protein